MEKLEEAKKLLEECNRLKTEYLDCHNELNENYLIYKKIYNKKMIDKSNTAISDLKVLLAYLRKHNELKMVYNSYKHLLKIMLNYKKKIIYFTELSKPYINDEELIMLVKEQNDIMNVVQQIGNIMPNLSSEKTENNNVYNK